MVKFSLVYPTQNRPLFIEKALYFISKQTYKNFEVIISDNCTDPSLSCELICKKASEKWGLDIKYKRTESNHNMVDNWNTAYQYVSGDYVLYFTDKMFLLPETLKLAYQCIFKVEPEIVNWIDDLYSPDKFPDYFGPGFYKKKTSLVSPGAKFEEYNCKQELSKKGLAACSREEQDASSYSRGKICFGAYKSSLCNRIIELSGSLFHPITPDYTSMILALSLAETAFELASPGIVHIHTDLSNGGNATRNEDYALRFLKSFNDEKILDQLPVPRVYSSVSNMVARDYLVLKERYSLNFEFCKQNWLVYIWEELSDKSKKWSDNIIKIEHINNLRNIIKKYTIKERLYIIFKYYSRRIRIKVIKRNLLYFLEKFPLIIKRLKKLKLIIKGNKSRKMMRHLDFLDEIFKNVPLKSLSAVADKTNKEI